MRSGPIATLIFGAFVVATLVITYWSSRRVRGTAGFYAAGGAVPPLGNGLAMAGDYLSAASFLGTIAVFYSVGVDGLLYVVGAVAGWPIAMFLVGERLRDWGRYTFSDALAHRLDERPMRLLAAMSTLTLCACYLIAQLVGAGTLVETLFGVRFEYSVSAVGVLMISYVSFGGMVATTWIQIIKATLLMLTAVAMVVLVLHRFGLDPNRAIAAAVGARGEILMRPGRLVSDPLSAVSLGIAFALGPAGLPHVLMRFFTVKDAQSARRSLAIATVLIGLFQILVVLLGYAAAALVGSKPSGGVNMAAVHLARALGGESLAGIAAAVAFATILAVVSGLILAGASAVSHDVFKHLWKRGHASEAAEIRVSRLATLGLGTLVIGLAIAFQHENIGFLATLPLVIAASVNFPVLVLAMHWRRLTTRGAFAGGVTGLVLSVGLIVLSKRVWVDVLGHSHAAFPYEYPTVFSLGGALLVTVIASMSDRDPSDS